MKKNINILDLHQTFPLKIYSICIKSFFIRYKNIFIVHKYIFSNNLLESQNISETNQEYF